MLTYSPKKFASLYDSDMGQRIWSFLTRDDNVALMETASELNKPAVEGIEQRLLAEFREEILADRVKQMVGYLVRQILEQRDWVLDPTVFRLSPYRSVRRRANAGPTGSDFTPSATVAIRAMSSSPTGGRSRRFLPARAGASTRPSPARLRQPWLSASTTPNSSDSMSALTVITGCRSRGCSAGHEVSQQ